MKRLFSSTIIAIVCCAALSAGDNKNKSNSNSNWHIMSGYGYSVMLGDMIGEGCSNVNSFVWQPRFYTSWSQEEFHLMGLFNIGFAF